MQSKPGHLPEQIPLMWSETAQHRNLGQKGRRAGNFG